MNGNILMTFLKSGISIIKETHPPRLIVNRMNDEQEVISRLKFIGKIKKGEKIDTYYMSVQPEGLVTSFKRTFWTHDSRNNTLAFIHQVMTRAFDLIIRYERSPTRGLDPVLMSNLLQDIKAAAGGITNLKHTYIIDIKFCCDMDTLLETIEAKLSRFERHSPSNFARPDIDEEDTTPRMERPLGGYDP